MQSKSRSRNGRYKEHPIASFNKYKPEKILTDNGKQFKESWEKFLKNKSIEPLFAHPYYPQDKGKVERTIRNVAEEFVNLLIKFPQWLGGQIKEYQIWYNQERLLDDFPDNRELKRALNNSAQLEEKFESRTDRRFMRTFEMGRLFLGEE